MVVDCRWPEWAVVVGHCRPTVAEGWQRALPNDEASDGWVREGCLRVKELRFAASSVQESSLLVGGCGGEFRQFQAGLEQLSRL